MRDTSTANGRVVVNGPMSRKIAAATRAMLSSKWFG